MILGGLSGLIGSVAAIAIGSSLWFAMLVYIIVGVVSTILLPVLLLALSKLGIFSLRYDVPTTDPAMRGPSTFQNATTTQHFASTDCAKRGVRVKAH